jgi:ABC-2 type transport system ATP-binding protein
MADYENAIQIQKLSVRYDGFLLDDISFSVPKGSIMGFIGQNGAGKTTTIKAILNIVRREAGNIQLLGMDNIKNEREIKEQISAVFDEIPFQNQLNATQLERILREVYSEWNHVVYDIYLERLMIPKRKKIGDFSKGMKMKLQIAAALSHNAKLMIMDEATTGLDPVVRSECLDIFLEYLQEEDHSILMSSHITSDLEKVADSVTMIHNGKLLLTGYKDDVLADHGIIKCSKSDYREIEPEDIVSARVTDYSVEVMVRNRTACMKKYNGLAMDNASLEDILLFNVNAKKGEWS